MTLTTLTPVPDPPDETPSPSVVDPRSDALAHTRDLLEGVRVELADLRARRRAVNERVRQLVAAEHRLNSAVNLLARPDPARPDRHRRNIAQ